jgi:hypothetical protein
MNMVYDSKTGLIGIEKRAILSVDSDIKFEETHHDEQEEEEKEKKAAQFSLFQPIEFIASTAKKVVVDTALGTATKILKTGVTTVGQVILDKKEYSNEEFLAAKNLTDAFKLIDQKLLKSRLIMGTTNCPL